MVLGNHPISVGCTDGVGGISLRQIGNRSARQSLLALRTDMLLMNIPKDLSYMLLVLLVYLLSVRSSACTLRSSWASERLEAPTSRDDSNAR